MSRALEPYGMDIQVAFGKRIRELRKRAGLSQAKLAEKCGAGFVAQSVGEIERGERNCTLQTLARLAKALKCEPADLFLFRAPREGETLSRLDARYVDFWKAADEPTRRKAIRILSELL